MFCPQCGIAASDSDKFCKNCGQALPLASPTATRVAPVQPGPDATSTQEGTFEFTKSKMLGYLTYRTVKATVEVSGSSVTVRKSANTVGFKSKEKVVTLNRSDIKNIHLVDNLDLVDGIYVSIFGFVALVTVFYNLNSYDPNWISTLIALGIAALCFFTGWGKNILIWTKDPKPLTIQTKTGENEEELVAMLGS